MDEEWSDLKEDIEDDLEHEWGKEIGSGSQARNQMTFEIGETSVHLQRSEERPHFFSISLIEDSQWNGWSMFDCKIVPYLYEHSQLQKTWPQPRKAIAFFMGQTRTRLGEHSLLRLLDDELLKMIWHTDTTPTVTDTRSNGC